MTFGAISAAPATRGKLRYPMVAATLAKPFLTLAIGVDDQLVFDIVANYVYTVLGKIEEGGRRYVVLRNPGGASDAWAVLPNGRSWNTLALGMDGVFALEFDAFVAVYVGERSTVRRSDVSRGLPWAIRILAVNCECSGGVPDRSLLRSGQSTMPRQPRRLTERDDAAAQVVNQFDECTRPPLH